ncbi:MAG: hypothetical protein NTX48_11435 [Planctomycetales bacterium]|nr:hypothetical protein [Planctomycetales bacterium]
MRAVLAGKSKTVSKMNDTLQQFLTLSTKFRIHDSGDSLQVDSTLKAMLPLGSSAFLGGFHHSPAIDAISYRIGTGIQTEVSASTAVSTQGNHYEFRIEPGLQKPFFQPECGASILPTF